MTLENAPIVAQVSRGALVESVHHGLAVVLDPQGRLLRQVGDPQVQIYARSSLKPLLAVAMLRAGVELSGQQLALACASHSGEEQHLDVALSTLADHGLTAAALRNTPDLPYGAGALEVWLAAGRRRESLAQNCSGKHAAMLATCVHNGWPLESYLELEHPLQQLIAATVAELTGDKPAQTTVDGCGAPLFSCTLAGLARAFGAIASADSGELKQVGDAMRRHPELVGGTGRDVTELMRAIPGLVTKDGAEAVQGLGLPDGRCLAIKIADGGQRARPVVVAALLAELGFDDPEIGKQASAPVLGHGQPVGAVTATLPRRGER